MTRIILEIGLVLGLIGIGVVIDRILIRRGWGQLGPPINRVPEECPDISTSERAVLELYMKEWEVIINTQMHFNDLILRFRSITLTAFLALVGAAVALLKIAPLERSDFLIIVAIIVTLWVTAFILDFGYYHRLLLGAVAQGLKFDENKRMSGYGMFGMTTCISQHVQPPTSRVLVAVYYLVPLFVVTGLLFWKVV